MSEPKKRPGTLWLFFYGRKRRGFPWLLAWVLVGVMLGALSFRLVGGADAWRDFSPIFAGALIVGMLIFAVAAWLRPRRR